MEIPPKISDNIIMFWAFSKCVQFLLHTIPHVAYNTVCHPGICEPTSGQQLKMLYVCRHFKLILHRNVDVLSSDFKARAVDGDNREENVDVEGEFYHGFEECKLSDQSVTTAACQELP